MKLYKLTYLLLGLAFIGALGSLSGRMASLQVMAEKNQDEADRKAKAIQRQAELRSSYLTVDYDEKESADENKRAVQRQRKLRHNNRPMVSKEPSPKDKEVSSYAHGQFDFPALPIEKSELVVMADVLQADAHMSEDKGSVYTEFEVRLLEVFKSPNSKFVTGDLITVERLGGRVKYPHGQQILYRIKNCGMPKFGGRYLLFLNVIPDTDTYRILTGYEISLSGVTPLDLSPQFEAYRGSSQTKLLTALRSSLQN